MQKHLLLDYLSLLFLFSPFLLALNNGYFISISFYKESKLLTTITSTRIPMLLYKTVLSLI